MRPPSFFRIRPGVRVTWEGAQGRTKRRTLGARWAAATLLAAFTTAAFQGCRPAVEEAAAAGSSAAAAPAASTETAAPARADDGSAAPSSEPGNAEPVRNVLLITIDTLRADSLGFAGESRVATPVLDRMAAGGFVFDNAHAHNVVTLPSHVNILSGLYPHQHGVRDNSGFQVDAATATAATLFGSAGFATAAVVGAFPLSSRYGLDRGFDLYDDRFSTGWGATGFSTPERRGDEVVARGLDWWRANEGRRRFLWLHLYDPHAPYAAPEPFASRYPTNAYLGEVAAVDSFLDPFLTPFLSDADGGGDSDPTLIVFTSDHGEGLGEHAEATHGTFAYEPTLKVPLVLWRRGWTGRTSDRPARHVDLLPTMLDAAGLDVPEGLAGASLLRPPAGPVSTYFEALTPFLNYGWAPLRGTIEGGSKLISLPIAELYDLGADPGEAANRFGDDRDEARRLARMLPEETRWPPLREPASEEERRALASLGYLTSNAPPRATFSREDDPKILIALDAKLHDAFEVAAGGDPARAEAMAREILAARPMATVYQFLGQLLAEAGRWSDAAADLGRAVEQGITDPHVLRQLAVALTKTGGVQEAISLLRPYADSGDPEFLIALGSALIEGERLGEARRALQRATAIEPSNPLAHETLALAALREERWAAVEAHARDALAIDDDLSLAWNYLGGALFNQGRATEAIEALDRSVRADPGNFDALFNLAIIANQAGDRTRALAALRDFVARAPADRYGPDIERARGWLAGGGG